MRTASAFVVLVAMMCACMTAGISETRDPFSNCSIIEYSKGLKLHYEGQDDLMGTLLGVQMSEYGINLRGSVPFDDPAKATTSLVMEYYGADWFFIREGSAVQFLYRGGESETFDALNVTRDTFVSGGEVWCHERAYCRISTSAIDSLCDGRVSLIRLNGREVYQDLTVPEITRTRLVELWGRIRGVAPAVEGS